MANIVTNPVGWHQQCQRAEHSTFVIILWPGSHVHGEDVDMEMLESQILCRVLSNPVVTDPQSQ